MRVQVMTEEQAGYCPDVTCRFHTLLTGMKRVVVFIGAAMEASPWRCQEDFWKSEKEGFSLEIEQPVIDMSGPPSRRVRNTSRKRELEIAADIGGRRQPGSGNQPFTKGDIRKKGDFRVEAKECFGLEFKAHRVDLLDKIRAECSRGEHPAVVITFRDKGTHAALESWVMVPYEIWEERIVAGKNR